MATTNAVQMTVSAGLPPARLDALARDLARDLTRSGAVKAKPVEVPAGPGERGVAAKIGELLLEAIGGAGLKTVAETAKVLGDVLKAYLVREKTLRIELMLPDGTKVVLDAKNMSVSAIEAAVVALRKPG